MRIFHLLFVFKTICDSFVLNNCSRALNINIWRGKKLITKIHRSNPTIVTDIVDFSGLSFPFIFLGICINESDYF